MATDTLVNCEPCSDCGQGRHRCGHWPLASRSVKLATTQTNGCRPKKIAHDRSLLDELHPSFFIQFDQKLSFTFSTFSGQFERILATPRATYECQTRGPPYSEATLLTMNEAALRHNSPSRMLRIVFPYPLDTVSNRKVSRKSFRTFGLLSDTETGPLPLMEDA